MVDKIVSVAIVGCGRTGAPLLEALLALPFIRVVGVADRDSDSPGARLAVENDIFFTVNADVLAAKADQIDLIIEVSGDPTVKPALKQAFLAQDNSDTIIVHDLVARLILTLATGADELAPSFHPHDTGVGA